MAVREENPNRKVLEDDGIYIHVITDGLFFTFSPNFANGERGKGERRHQSLKDNYCKQF